MNIKSFFLTILLIVLIGTVGALVYGVILKEDQNLKEPPSEEPTQETPPDKSVSGQNNTDFPLQLPEGFSISVFAKDLPGARVMAFDSLGNLWLSRTGQGVITLLEIKDGQVTNQQDVFRNLNNPHGLAFDPASPLTLYFAQEDGVFRVPLYSEASPEKIIDLPEGGGHFTRTLLFGSDNKLYISIGSSCNVCLEEDSRRAKIFVANKDGSNFKEFASGLRNAVFMTRHPQTGEIWATEMGRDYLGDNLPPDEINIIKEGRNYGWPYCYGKNIVDVDFASSDEAREICSNAQSSLIDIPAHSAPLGLTFIPDGWPKEYEGDLITAYHGFWNRSVPTGYKLVRFKFDGQGDYQGVEDFITGWIDESGQVFGRPVDVLIDSDGIMYVSDDRAGIIYKVEHSD